MKTAELYDLDFAQWAKENAELLRSGRFSEADIEHVAEEIEDLAKRKWWALCSRFARLIEHLLKWQFQPERRGTSWKRTIAVQRERYKTVTARESEFAARPRFSNRQGISRSGGEHCNNHRTITERFPRDLPLYDRSTT